MSDTHGLIETDSRSLWSTAPDSGLQFMRSMTDTIDLRVHT